MRPAGDRAGEMVNATGSWARGNKMIDGYFNCFTEIEEHFQQARDVVRLLSPRADAGKKLSPRDRRELGQIRTLFKRIEHARVCELLNRMELDTIRARCAR